MALFRQRPTITLRKPQALARLLSLAFAASILTASCATIQRDILYDTAEGSALAELDGLENRLVELRAYPDPVLLVGVMNELAKLAGVSSTDAVHRARLASLSAEAASQASDQATASRKLAESRAAYPGDELAAVVASRLARTDEEKLAILEAALKSTDGFYRIRAESGAVLQSMGRYREALAAFDAALPFLPLEYGALYGAQRDRAFALRGSDSTPAASTTAYLTKEPLPLMGLAVVAQNETTALDWLTGGADWAPGVLFDRLKASGWFADPAAPPLTPASRKDAALFLWNLMARGESKLLTRYSVRYASRASSPVPDVPYGSPWFDAVLGVVEENIMTLPDGRSFSIDTVVSGLDFYAWLKAAAAWR